MTNVDEEFIEPVFIPNDETLAAMREPLTDRLSFDSVDELLSWLNADD